MIISLDYRNLIRVRPHCLPAVPDDPEPGGELSHRELPDDRKPLRHPGRPVGRDLDPINLPVRTDGAIPKSPRHDSSSAQDGGGSG